MVRALCRDHYGYLWIGNQAYGLMRYDGYEVIRYIVDETRDDSISNPFIRCILEDSNKVLWVGTRAGLHRYVRETDSFVLYKKQENNLYALRDDRIESIYEDDQKRLWIVSSNALQLYDRDNDRFTAFIPSKTDRSVNFLKSMVQDDRGRYWLVGHSNAILSFDLETGAFEAFDRFPPKRPVAKKFYKDASGEIWVVGVGSIFQFHPEEITLDQYEFSPGNGELSRRTGSDIVEYPIGQLLVAIDQGGLGIFDKASKRFSYQKADDGTGNGLSSNGLISLYKDYEGIVWVGTSRIGMDFHNPKMGRFTTHRKKPFNPEGSLADNVVGCVFEDSKGRVWIGTDGGGISILNPDTGVIRNLKHRPGDPASINSNVVRQIDQDSSGDIWVGMWQGGISVLRETENEAFVNYLPKLGNLRHLDNSSIWDIEIDRKDRLWVTTTSGSLALYDAEGQLISDFTDAGTFRIGWSLIVTEIENGEILILGEKGVYRFNEETKLTELFLKAGKSTAVAFDQKNRRYYVGTVSSGGYLFDANGRELSRFSVVDGLPNDFIRSIQIYNEDEIWIGTNSGLCRYRPSLGEFSNFYGRDGLQGNQYFINSSCQTRAGHFYFGGNNGLSSFEPKLLTPNAYIPHVVVDRISISGKELSHKDLESPISMHPHALKELELDWRQNFLNFGFTAISMTYPENNRYAYMLEGVDDGWIYADASNRSANYTNIDPGEYVFRVKASNNDGAWNEQGTAIRLTITPPFWRRIWFYCLSVTLLGAAVYWYIRFRERRLEQARKGLERVVEERTRVIHDQNMELQAHRDNLEDVVNTRTSELMTAKEKAEESDRLKSEFLANISHEIRTPLNAIVGFSSILNEPEIDDESRERYLTVIGENSDELMRLIEDILDFSMITTNQMKIKPRPFSINEFIDNTHSSYLLNADSEPIELRVYNEVFDEDLQLVADRMRIKQVIDNLMTNAFKFTEKGFIDLRVCIETDTILFSVHDTGHGIPGDQIDAVFEKFAKLREDELAARRGVGLGLAISRRLAVLMGGELSVESRYGEGSVFTLTLPLSVQEEGPSEEQSSTMEIGDDRLLAGKKLLIIEDEKANYMYLEEALKRIGIESIWAKSGMEGLSLLERNGGFDLVLLDIKIPEMGGFEVFKRIREIDPKVCVIAQTAYAMKDDEIRIRRAGFDDYLAKPIQPTVLKDMMGKHL